MAPNNQQLSHDEVWDDAALVSSWNNALEEYKKYHSIHSKGGNVDDLLNAAKAATTSDAKDGDSVPDVSVSHPTINEGEVEEEKPKNDRDKNGNSDIRHSHSPAESSTFIPAPLLGSGEFQPDPQLLSDVKGGKKDRTRAKCGDQADKDVVRDESLKKLLISWYYAGYYTGYYEGQRENPSQQ